jgi:4-amino-4-deoxy-L-arabinose transferase-like glycosyltransferase
VVSKLTPTLSGLVQRYGKWRLTFLAFLLAYTILLLLYLGYAAIQWDETPHLVGGLLLSRGQIHEYTMKYMFYPPLFDSTTALYYLVLGASVFSVRLVALTFGILTVWAVFEYSYRIYGPRSAMLSSILLASMPGVVILSRLALIETMLMFFFSTSLFLFFLWAHKKNNKLLLLSGVAVGLGIIAKYQAFISVIVMLVSLLVLWRKRISKKLVKILIVAVIVVAVVLPLFLFVYQHSISETLGDWLYAIQVGNEERTSYSERFPFPIFYLIEMTYPYAHTHPISAPLFIISLIGLGYCLWRRRAEDKFSLIWFLVVYSVFTFIPNKDWRYITLVFPVLAISASELILFMWDKVKGGLTANKMRLHRASIPKVAAVVFVLLIAVSFVYSWGDAYSWVDFEHASVPVKEVTQYVIANSTANESTVLLFTDNFFSKNMVEFYLILYNASDRILWQYPEKPADAYSPSLNETWLIERCEATNVKFLLLYEHGNETYLDSTWRAYYILDKLVLSGRFKFEWSFGTFPRRLIIIQFIPDSIGAEK